MLDKIPMELIRRASGNLEAKVLPDESAVRELCELLRPHVGPILGLLSQHSSGRVERYVGFFRVVRTAVHEPWLKQVEGENLTGQALALFMLSLRDHAKKVVSFDSEIRERYKPGSSAERRRPRAGMAKRPGSRDAVLGGGGDDPSALPLSVYFDLSTTPPDVIVDLLVALSDLYRSVGATASRSGRSARCSPP